jgi:death-on-curing protein
MTFGQQRLHSTVPEQAAAYPYHLVMNHPFVDGNKRTAFAVMDTFLRVNGYRLTLTDDAAFDLVMRVARGQLGFAEKVIKSRGWKMNKKPSCSRYKSELT